MPPELGVRLINTGGFRAHPIVQVKAELGLYIFAMHSVAIRHRGAWRNPHQSLEDRHIRVERPSADTRADLSVALISGSPRTSIRLRRVIVA